ncbi:hypothetical protein HZA96_06750 [Candidatus Woesearchaeota archaeon]|nr:hypothetical protein [Candidatus Woesearchaeota archaeon]
MGSAPNHKRSDIKIPKWAVEQDKFNKTTKYPYCRGTFPDCPEEIKQDIVDTICKICPVYKQK